MPSRLISASLLVMLIPAVALAGGGGGGGGGYSPPPPPPPPPQMPNPQMTYTPAGTHYRIFQTPGTYTFIVPAYDTLYVTVNGAGGGGAASATTGAAGGASTFAASAVGGLSNVVGGGGGGGDGGTPADGCGFGGTPPIDGAPGTASGGNADGNTTGGGEAGGTGTANGGRGGQAVKTFTGELTEGASITITIGSGGVGGGPSTQAGTSGSVWISWTDPTPSCSVTLDASPIAAGAATNANWTSRNANLMSINTLGYVGLTGSLEVSPTTTTDYTGTATAPTKVYLTSGTQWTVPATWNSTSNSIEVIGGGGGGAGIAGTGGGGGAYAKKTNVSLTPGASVKYYVGSGGGSGSSGGDTYFCNSSDNCSSINGSAVVVGAKGGISGGAGGAAASSIGTSKYSGGSGGAGYAGAGGGGGGAGGIYGNGADGSYYSSGGGGGGSTGGSSSGANTGIGGNNITGVGGGAFGSAGVQGGGGGGGGDATSAGGAGVEWFDTPAYGAGGGGGGGAPGACDPCGGCSSGTIGGSGGNYGGGGGGGASDSLGGSGAPGIIVITYTPTSGGYQCPATLSVIVPACTLSVAPTSISSGGSATLSWTSTADVVGGTLWQKVGGVTTVLDQAAPSGSKSVSPTQSTFYSGRFSNANGYAVWCNDDGSGNDPNNSLNVGVTLTISCTPTYSCEGNQLINSCSPSQPTVCGGETMCVPDTSECVVARSASASGFYDDQGVWHTGHIEAHPNLVRRNTTSKLFWNVSDVNASTCSVSGTNGDVVSTGSASSGASGRSTIPINQHTIYTLTCTGLNGATFTESTTVRVIPIFREL